MFLKHENWPKLAALALISVKEKLYVVSKIRDSIYLTSDTRGLYVGKYPLSPWAGANVI
jgi:hypothetical protein